MGGALVGGSETKKNEKKTYEVFLVMIFALRANIITRVCSRILPCNMSEKLCVAKTACEICDHVVRRTRFGLERVRLCETRRIAIL